MRMLCQVNNKYTSQRDTDCMIPLIEATQGSQVHRDRKQNGGCQGLGKGRNGELLSNGYRVLVLQDEKVLEMGYTTL